MVESFEKVSLEGAPTDSFILSNAFLFLSGLAAATFETALEMTVLSSSILIILWLLSVGF